MNTEPENQTTGQSPVSSDTPSSRSAAADSLEERLLKLDAKASKKALHDSRVLKRLGIVFYVLAACLLLLEPLLIVLPRLPGFGGMKVFIRFWSIVNLPLIVVVAAYGVALRTSRSNVAKWLFRIVAILGIVGGVLKMISLVRLFKATGIQGPEFGGFIGELTSVLISIRLVIITYNDILFGPNPPSHNQLGYVRSKWKDGQRPEHIPERVHKPPRYAKLCLYISFLLIPFALWHMTWGLSDQMNYAHAQEYYNVGVRAFIAAGQADDIQKANEQYIVAYINFSLAASDPENKDVHVYLGYLAARGLGCAKDEREAFKQLSMFPAATNNYPDAQYELALLYLYGRGTDRDAGQAALLLKAAAQKGHRGAMELLGYELGKLDENGEEIITEPDYGGKTVEEFLEEKIKKEAVENAGKDSGEEDEEE